MINTLEAWKAVDFGALQTNIKVNLNDIVEHSSKLLLERKDLIEKTRGFYNKLINYLEFRKTNDTEQISNLLKLYHKLIDNLFFKLKEREESISALFVLTTLPNNIQDVLNDWEVKTCKS